MDEQKDPKRSWAERKRENKRLKQERTGDSPGKAAERRGPQPDVIDKTLKLGGIDRPSNLQAFCSSCNGRKGARRLLRSALKR